MSNKQSSVEWLRSLYESRPAYEQFITDEEWEQAKEMHKEECIDLLNHHNDIFDTSEEHYNKWFGGKDEQQ